MTAAIGSQTQDLLIECYQPQCVRTTMAQLRSESLPATGLLQGPHHCWLDACPEWGVAPHSIQHLFHCPARPTQLTVDDLWDDPNVVADFLNREDAW